MPHSHRPRVRASTPWDSTEQAIHDPGHDYADTQQVAYRCGKHEITLTFAADIAPPDAWDCQRCGQTALRDGAPQDAKPVTRKYGPPAYRSKGRRDDGVDPWSQLMKRRSVAELEAMLAERLAALRATGAAR